MLQQKPTDPVSSDLGLAPSVGLAGADPMQAIDAILASPEFQNFDSFDATSPLFEDSGSMSGSPLFEDTGSLDSFLTSPMETPYADFSASPGEDSPFNEFLTTPILPSSDEDMLTGPLIEDVGFADDSLSLFGSAAAFPTYHLTSGPKLPPTPEMYTLSPGGTPPLDSINPSSTVIKKKKSAPAPAPPPSPPSPNTAAAPAPRRRVATGTRKNLKPESLLGMEAPTQKRSYAMPSATSRKAVPAVWANKKRAHAAAFGVEEEQIEELSPTASEKEAIEHKRRQNTLAARKSRKRKLEHQQLLEQENATVSADRDKWKARALMAQQMLRDNGITLNFED